MCVRASTGSSVPLSKCRARDKIGQHGDAGAALGELAQREQVVDAHARHQPQAAPAAAAQAADVRRRARGGHGEQVVALQILETTRPAAARQIVRRSAEHDAHRAERARRERRVRQPALAHRQVDLVLDEIDPPPAEHDVELELRMRRGERRQHRRQTGAPERRRRRQAYPAAHFLLLVAHRRLGLFEGVEQRPRALIEIAAGGGRTHAARRALEQARAERALQARDLLAHRRRRQAEALAGGGEAGGVDDQDERTDGGDMGAGHL